MQKAIAYVSSRSIEISYRMLRCYFLNYTRASC